MLFLRERELLEASTTVRFEAPVEADERHLAALSFRLSEGSANWRILDGNRVVQHSGEVTSEDPADQFLAVGDRPGDWTLEADTTDASGLLFAAWARFVGRGAPCPEDAECVGLPSSATGDAE